MGERYELHAEIARGGMGRVVEATDTVLGRTVALKEVLVGDDEALRRFAREIRITARLEHPAIVPVHDAGVLPSGKPYYVMRRISGKPLEKLVVDAASLDARLALLPHLVNAAQAIAHAHDRGVVHRDIKPSNILVGELGETMVIDWGLAKAMDEADEPGPDAVAFARPAQDPVDAIHTRAGIVYGTPGFVAPEQLRGLPADARTDVYALGATLYYLLGRRTPHQARDPDAMMRAAVERSPQPIAQLVAGVPLELADIVDKALALDAAARYPTARALAADLARFLTGQLVAAHRYSRAERVARFVRRHLAAVAVGSAATLALAVVGWVAVARIVTERDRADDARRVAERETEEATHQRDAATDRADQLVLGQAQALAATNPTLAVALVKPLAGGKWWRKARAIGAAARFAGVAYGYPASARTIALDVARDGKRALSIGGDGVIRIYDLVHHTTRDVPAAAYPTAARFVDSGVVVAARSILEIIDLASGATRDLELATAIVPATLVAAGHDVYWVDAVGRAWHLDVAQLQKPEAIATPEPVRWIAVAPDHAGLAVGGVEHLFAVQGAMITPIFNGETSSLVWGDGHHFAAIAGDQVIEAELNEQPTAEDGAARIDHKTSVGERTTVTMSGGRTFVETPSGIVVAMRERGGVSRKALTGFDLGIVAAKDAVVTASPQGSLAVVSDAGDRVITTPGLELTALAGARESPYVVAASDGRVLVWNLDDVLPRRVTSARPTSAATVDATHAAVATEDGTAWLELATGKSTPVDLETRSFATLIASPDGTRAIAIDGLHHARAISPSAPAIDLGDAVSFAAFAGSTRVVHASGGTVRARDLTGTRDDIVVQRSAPVVALAVSGGRVIAVFADHAVWRGAADGTGGAVLAATMEPTTKLASDADGAVIYGAGFEVRRCTLDAPETTLATLPHTVAEVALADGAIVAITTDGAAFTIARDGTARSAPDGPRISSDSPVPTRLASGARPQSVSATGLYVGSPQPGKLVAYDVVAGASWPLADDVTSAPELARISADGGTVVALAHAGLLAWSLRLPDGPARTRAWLDDLTDAGAAPDATTVVWK